MMGPSTAYGPFGNDEETLALLDRTWELGYTNWDTANSYGDSEAQIGNLEFFSECLEGSLQKMGVDYVDLYYVHRLNPKVPVEKTMELMAEAKKRGTCCHATAYAVAPVDAVQNKTGTNLLSICRELGITVFAYAPLGRGILTGPIKSTDDFAPDDFRRVVPRFSPGNFPKNLVLVDRFGTLADKTGCTPGHLALAWLSAQGEDIISIPGTKKLKYMRENVGALKVHISKEEVQEIRDEVEKAGLAGHRNPPGTFTEYSVTVEL
ncbi:NADP-dependent oxidoreductase domain-containing protein [Nemania abortiva]|nr:NADP-dependent oxidoreductase domain-containing protein [Nemania abortiva]